MVLGEDVLRDIKLILQTIKPELGSEECCIDAANRIEKKLFGKCETCGDHREIGVFKQYGSSTEKCPDCLDTNSLDEFKLLDKAYRNGLMAGFCYGINSNEEGFAKSLEAYERQIYNVKST